jgi:HK97 family phage portal protein
MAVLKNLARKLWGLSTERSAVNQSYYPAGFLSLPFSGSIGKVDEYTAIRISAVYSCVNLIASTISSLPWVVYEDDGQTKRRATNHFSYQMLKIAPNQYITSKNYRQALLTNALLWGNGYARIIRDDVTGAPTSLMVLKSSDVTPYIFEGELFYQYAKGGLIHADDMIHIKGIGFDGILGLSPIGTARSAFTSALGADKFGAKFFENGAMVGGYIEHPAQLTKEQFQNYSDFWESRWSGIDQAGKTAILDNGAKYHTVTIPLADVQFIESKKFNVEDIARIFQVPPHKIGQMDRATFNNIEEQNISFVEGTILNWTTSIESEHDRKLIAPTNRSGNDIYNKIELKGLLRGDIKSRTEFYTKMWDRGIFSGNDIRKLEELDGYEGGDNRYIPLNMQNINENGEPNNTDV